MLEAMGLLAQQDEWGDRAVSVLKAGFDVLVIVALGLAAYFIFRQAIRVLTGRGRVTEGLAELILGAARWMVTALVVVLALEQVGVETAGIWAAMLTVGAMVAIGFVAVWSVLSNVLCSLLLAVFRPFRIGDEIELIEATGGKGLRGKVAGFNVLFTLLEEPMEDGGTATVEIPNNLFFQKTIRRRTAAAGGRELEDALMDRAREPQAEPKEK